MSDVLVKIKRLVLKGRYEFSKKARGEMEMDGITETDVIESILNAGVIYKTIRSTSPLRKQAKEYLYVIQSTNLDGLFIYSKGKFVQEAGVETYYFLVSSKRSVSE
jgi:hypothetical protein